MIDLTQVTLLLFVVARMSGFVLFNPVLGRSTMPAIFRGGLVMVLSMFAFSVARSAVGAPTSTLELMLKLLLELFLGLILGFVVNFFFYIPQLMGEMVDTQMGMTMNQIYDPASKANNSVTAMLMNILMTMLFFAANGHHTLIKIFITSEQILPYGNVMLTSGAMQEALKLFTECTLLAVKLALPILAAELVGQFGMGVLMKVIPQINVFSINLELKILVGLSMLLLLIAPFSEFFLQIEGAMLQSLTDLLALSG